jgi:DNA-binding protein H-NS
MNELAKLDKSISDLEAQLSDLRSKREDIVKKEKQAAIEAIKKQMQEMGLSASDLKDGGKPKRKQSTKAESSGRYYLIDNEKIAVSRGRMNAKLKALKDKGLDLATVLYNADGSKA